MRSLSARRGVRDSDIAGLTDGPGLSNGRDQTATRTAAWMQDLIQWVSDTVAMRLGYNDVDVQVRIRSRGCGSTGNGSTGGGLASGLVGTSIRGSPSARVGAQPSVSWCLGFPPKNDKCQLTQWWEGGPGRLQRVVGAPIVVGYSSHVQGSASTSIQSTYKIVNIRSVQRVVPGAGRAVRMGNGPSSIRWCNFQYLGSARG